MYLELSLSALTVTGGSYSRFVNDANFLVRSIEVWSNGTNQVLQTKPSALASYLQGVLLNTTDDRLPLFADLANNTDTNRATLSASAQTVRIPIRSVLTVGGDEGEGLLIAGTTGFQIRVFLDSLSNIVQTDGTSPVCTINTANLLVETTNIDSAPARQQAVTVSKSNDVYTRFPGVAVMPSVAIASGSASATIPMTGIVGPVSHIYAVLRTSAHVSTALGNIPDQFEVASKLQIQKADGSQLLNPSLTTGYLTGAYLAKYFPGSGADNRTTTVKAIYTLSFSDNPADFETSGRSWGSQVFSGNESLIVTFASAISSAYVVDIIAMQPWVATQSAVTGQLTAALLP